MQEEITFGVWLRKQRRALDLSRQAFADQVGCAEVTLRRIEAGSLKPSKELARIILEKLGIPEVERPRWISFARGTSSFSPSTNSANKPITNLPAALTTFIGREKEQSDVIRLLDQHRLVTLTGPGGVGKTRLSIKVGEQALSNYPDGVWLVELAPILDPLLVPRITALAVGLRDEPQRPVMDMLSDYLVDKQMLLILDNCEHLLDACAQLTDILLKRCPSLKILVTSREALGILGAAIYHVPSLELPDIQQIVEKIRDYESVRLFEERAQLIRTDFTLTIDNAPAVAKICSRLDGIPLAIELAAARVNTFSAEQIAVRLQENLSFLTTGNRTALPRHQTLQAAIDWSYDLLSSAEQTLFRRLSVFVNGWTLEAVESICSDADIRSDAILDLLTQLINKSLVLAQEEHGVTRYRMLETVRQYSNEKLIEAGEREVLRDRHLEYFLNLAETAEPHLIRPEQIEWLPVLDADYENLRLAFEGALSKRSAESSLRLCAALGWFWEIRCYWLEGLDWVTRALAKPADDTNNEKMIRVRALHTRVILEQPFGHIEQMQISAQESLALALENSNERDIAIAQYFLAAALIQYDAEDAQALSLLKQCFGKFQELNELFWQAYSFQILRDFLVTQALTIPGGFLRRIELARRAGERLVLAHSLSKYADWLFSVDQVDKAKESAEESDRLYKQIGSEQSSINPLLFADIAWSNGDRQTARSLLTELHQRFSLLGEKGFRSNSAGRLGLLAMEEGDLDQAQMYLEEALSIEREAGWRPWEAFYLIELGHLFYLQGNIERFKQYSKEGFALRRYFPDFHKTFVLMTILGSLYVQKPESSAQLLGVINNPNRENDIPRNPIEKRYCVRAEAHARQVLGKAAFESGFDRGQKMSLDEGLDLALKTVEQIE